jgi:hypothetical protein
MKIRPKGSHDASRGRTDRQTRRSYFAKAAKNAAKHKDYGFGIFALLFGIVEISRWNYSSPS